MITKVDPTDTLWSPTQNLPGCHRDHRDPTQKAPWLAKKVKPGERLTLNNDALSQRLRNRWKSGEYGGLNLTLLGGDFGSRESRKSIGAPR